MTGQSQTILRYALDDEGSENLLDHPSAVRGTFR
jgi:hypothetical protein